jgi:filamentous hemagglutinin family protein
MKQHTQVFWIAGGVFVFSLTMTSSTQAQIVQDATLPVNSIVLPEGNITTITGGTVADRNLFHSFEQFNVDDAQRVDFVSPSADIQNILARVTGTARSEIMGTLSTSSSNPNLFLINPNGIVFGSNASLDVGGSFVATTANAIEFGNQGFFSASAPNDPGLLTVNPSAFLFNQIISSSIENNSIAPAGITQSGGKLNGLRVPDGRSLLLVGGNVSLDNGQLHALGGRVELGGVAEPGTVGLSIEDNNLGLSFPQGVQRADVSLTNGAVVNVTAGGEGHIAINARNLEVLGASTIQAGIGQTLGTVGSQAGDITLDVTEALQIAGSSITNDVGYEAVGNAGSIQIRAGALSLTDGTELGASTYGQGNAGGILIQANHSVSIANSLITSNADEPTGFGNGGGINIQAGELFLKDNAILDTRTSREGRAGNVMIDAQNISLDENSLISSETLGPGDGGIVDIRTQVLSLTEGAEILSTSTGTGTAGSIEINATDVVSISGVSVDGFSSGLITASEEEDSGSGNNITVTTGRLRLSDGGVLSARTRSVNPGGDITVNVTTLELENGGQLLTSTFNSGSAGNITVNATDRVTISGSDPSFDERLAEFGQRIVDNDGSASGLFARVRGNETANAGEINVIAQSIQLDDQGTFSSETTLGEGGNITLKAEDIVLRNNASITATAGTAQAGGNGGNININTDLLTALENSDITADAFEGQGGNIQITTQGLFLSPDSKITASSEFGLDGIVEINTPDIDPSRGLTNAPTEPVDASNQITQSCADSGAIASGQSQFIITGRGGLPPSPREVLSSDAVWVDLGELRETTRLATNQSRGINTPSPTRITTVPLVEAQGWALNDKGVVVLTSQVPTATPRSSWQSPATCGHS